MYLTFMLMRVFFYFYFFTEIDEDRLPNQLYKVKSYNPNPVIPKCTAQSLNATDAEFT